MTSKVTFTTAEWVEVDNLVTESLIDYARKVSEESLREEPRQAYLDQLKKHYELLKGIQRALVAEEELTDAEVYALERSPAYAVE
jgi:hypothetical protein